MNKGNSQNPFNNDYIDNTEEVKDIENIDNQEIENNEEITEEEIIEENNAQEENNELQEKFDELNNKYIRLAADFDNFRKRTTQEKEELSQYTIAKTLSQLTNVLDTFDRAQEQLKDVEECKTVKEGYEVVYKQLTEALKKIGLEEIEALGKEFNPNEHEAVTQIPTDEYEPDTVAIVMQKGYKLGQKIVRPALVGVATAK